MSEIIPVIHVIDFNQVKYNLSLCENNGIKSVFLINHSLSGSPVDDIISYYEYAMEKHKMNIGINFLSLSTLESIKKCNDINPSMVWTDNAHIYKKDDILKAIEIDNQRKSKSVYFGGIAFKYQKQPNPEDLKWVCEQATKYVDVVTTSGSATGSPADIEKIKTIRGLIGTHPLAIASGVNKDNKSIFSEYVDYMLVASSITNAYTEIINEVKLKELLCW